MTFRVIGVKVKGKKMYFLVNASPHKLFEVATSNFACELVTGCQEYLATFRVTLTPRSKVK